MAGDALLTAWEGTGFPFGRSYFGEEAEPAHSSMDICSLLSFALDMLSFIFLVAPYEPKTIRTVLSGHR